MGLAHQRRLFQLSSALTDRMPRLGARLLDSVFVPILSSRVLVKRAANRDTLAMARIGSVRRILVLPDIHLGDAVVHQSMVSALRDFFPTAQIHYAASKSAACLVGENPDITKLEAIYGGGLLPSAADQDSVARLCREGGFDLIVNACPFFDLGNPIPRDVPLLDFINQAPHILHNERSRVEPNHFLYQAHAFLHRALGRRFRPVREIPPLRGVEIWLSDAAYEVAEAYLRGMHGNGREPIVLVNPDTGSPFTRPPFELLVRVVEHLADTGVRVLVGEGHTDPGVGKRLMARLSVRISERVSLVPASMRADSYAALTDLVDVFISGDTGPLHWAAARKRSKSGRSLRNKTFVISLFGATPARMSGYDSSLPGFLPAWQDAPSVTLISNPPCRNITCLNKLQKTCRVARCFESLEAESILKTIMGYLDDVSLRGSVSAAEVVFLPDANWTPRWTGAKSRPAPVLAPRRSL